MSASFVLAAGVQPVLNAADQTLDTTTQRSFQVTQTASASGTGTITWSYSFPKGVSVVSSDGTQITFQVSVGTVIPLGQYKVSATNQIGLTATKAFTLGSAVKPILETPGPQTYDSRTGHTFIVRQTQKQTGSIRWNYGTLSPGIQVSEVTDQYILFSVDVGQSVILTTLNVTATNQAGITSDPISFTVEAYIPPIVTGTSQILDTTTSQTFSLTQTVPTYATGPITWGYTGGGGPSLVSSTDSGITFLLTGGSVFRNAIPFTVTATNYIGVSNATTITVTSGTKPVVTTPVTTIITDTTTNQTYTISQTASPTATGPVSWRYDVQSGTPAGYITTSLSQSDSSSSFSVNQGSIIKKPITVLVTARTPVGFSNVLFTVQAASTPALVSPGAQNLDTSTANTFTIQQTTGYTGGVTWNVTPDIPNAILAPSDSGLLVTLPANTSFVATVFTVKATNSIGVSTSVSFTVTAAVKPVLVSPTQLSFDTTTQQSFTVGQTSAGPMSWSYTNLSSGISAVTSDSGATFTIAPETYFSAKNFVVQATNLSLVSTSIGIVFSAGVDSALTMNFGGTTVGSITDGGAFQANGPPPSGSYPTASLYTSSPSNPQSSNVYGQPYGNGLYVIAASSALDNYSNVFSYINGVYWTSAATYSSGVYTGGQVTYVDGVAVSGEWIQIQLPDTITCTSLQLIEVGNANATSYVIAGSNDGSVWHNVYTGTGTVQASDFFTTVLNVTGVTTAYDTYKYIVTTTNPASASTRLSGFQVIGSLQYVSPSLVNPQKINFIGTAEQVFSIQQTSNTAATGPLSWSTTPVLVDTSTTPVTATASSLFINGPYLNSATGSFAGPIQITDSKLDVDLSTSSEFTIEFWVYGTSTSKFGSIISRAVSATLAAQIDWEFYQDDQNTYFEMNTYRVGVQRKLLSAFAWNHVAIVNSGHITTLYINGIPIASNDQIGGSYIPGRPVFIGGGTSGTNFSGQIADVRIVNGYAVYTGSFNVPSVPLSVSTQGLTLLLLQVQSALPQGFSVQSVSDSAIAFKIGRAVAVSQNLTVQAQNLTGGYSSITFLMDSTPTFPDLSSASPFVIPTYQATTFKVFQTASPALTGDILWSYTTLPAGVTQVDPEDDTQITFQIAQYAVPYQQSFTVSALGDYGVTVTNVTVTGYGNTPVLTSNSPYVIATSAGTTFTVNQTALYTGTITWTYSTLPAGVTVSTSDDTQITFAVATNSTSPLTSFTVTATSFYGAGSTTISYISSPPAGPVSSIQQTSSTGNSTISLAWTAGTSAVGYQLVTTPATTTQTTSGTAYTFTGLTAATQYTFTISSQNSIGAYSSPVTSGNMYTSAAPTNVTAGTVSGTSVPITWTAGTGVTSYEITSSPATSTQTSVSSPYTFTDLTGGTAYTFTVQSIVPLGYGGTGSTVGSITPAAAVSAINSVTIASLSSVTVNWTSSASATSYSLTTTPATTTQTTSSTTFTKTGLALGVSYTLTVASVNSYGTGGTTTSSTFVIPTAVTNLTLGNPQITTVDLAWTPSFGGTSYSITSTPATTTQTTTNAGSYTFTGLLGGTNYTFTVTSVNAFGNGDAATSSSIQTLPAAPTNLTLSNIGLNTMDVSWTASSGATLYTITTVPATTTQTTSSTSITKSGLANGTSYVIRVQASNPSGSGGTASSSSTYTLSPAVTNLVASNPQVTTVDLTWTSAFGASSYSITTTPLSSTQTTTNPSSYTFTGLTGGTNYTFTVISVNSSGPGGAVISSPAILTRPAAVTNLAAGTATRVSMPLTWTASQSATLYTITTSPVTTTQTTAGTSITKTSLNPGVLYTYYVLATNGSGDGGTSSVQKITLSPAVTNFVTTNPQRITMDLTWTDALGAVSYSIVSSPATTTQPAPYGGAYTFTSLTAGIQYTFTISSVNSSGTGDLTATTAAVYTLPPAVASVTPTTPASGGTTSMVLTWPSALSATNYSIASNPSVATSPQTSATSPYTFTGLAAGTVYTFTVTSINSSGSGDLTTTSASRITLPSPPTGFTAATPTTNNSVDLSWTSSVGATSYSIVSSPATTTQTTTNASAYTFTGLAAGTDYTFTVTAINTSGNSETTASTTSVRTRSDPPTSLTASIPAFTSDTSDLNLTWTAAVGATSYQITSTPATTTQSGITGTSFTFPGLTAGTQYTFTIQSNNASGLSVTSTTSNAKWTRPAAVPTITPSNGTSTSIDLTWTTVTGASQYSITSNPTTTTRTSATSPYTFPFLTGGTGYLFTITPQNADGDIGVSTTTGSAFYTLPQAATSLATTSPQRLSMGLTWTDGAGANSYRATSTPASSTYTGVSTGGAYTFNGLSAGTSYTFTLQSYNNTSGYGDSVTSASRFTLSAAVTSLTSSVPSTALSVTDTTTMNLNWTSATGATQYSIVSSPTTTTQTTPTGNPSSYTFTGLTAGTQYTFTVSSINPSGTGDLTATTTALYTRPPTPGTPSLNSQTSNGAYVDLTFTVAAYSTSATSNTYYLTNSASTTISTTNANYPGTFGTVVPNTDYTVYIVPINPDGAIGLVSPTSATFTLIPGPVVSASTTNASITQTQIPLLWSQPNPLGLKGTTGLTYTITGTGLPSTPYTSISTTSYTIGSLSAGTLYPTSGNFSVTAVNSAGSSSIVSVPAILTLPPASGVPQIGTIGQTTVILSIAAGQFSKSATSNTWTSTPSVATSPQTSANHPYTFTGLTPNTSYTFTAQAINSTGAGGTSGSSASALTLPGAPTSPLTSGITRVAITLSWTAPVNGAASYTVSGTGVTTVSGLVGTSTTFSGLTAGNSYGPFTIQSFNATGGGGSVSTASAVNTLPPAVTGFTATAGGSTTQTIPLTWTAANGATGYTITYTDGTLQSVSVGAVTTKVITGLSTSGGTYSFTITSTNASGSGDLTASTTGYTAPSAPSGLATGTVTATNIPLTWSAPGGTITTYTLTATNVPGSPITINYGTNPTSYTITGLSGATSYGPFTLVANNTGGTSSASNQAAAVTTVLGTPTGLNVTGTSTSGFTINWTAPAGGGAASYVVSGNGLAPQTINGATSATFSGLSPNTGYGPISITAYSAINAGGTSGPAASSGSGTSGTVYTVPNAPTSIVVQSGSATLGSFTVQWTSPGGTGTLTYSISGTGSPTPTSYSGLSGTSSPVYSSLTSGNGYNFSVTATGPAGFNGAQTGSAGTGTVYTLSPGVSAFAVGATDPRTTTYGGVFSGQAIQTAQLEVGYGVMSGAPGVQFTTKPTYTPGASAVFSITFDIFVTSAAPSWRNIFAHNAQNNDAGNRAPSFYLTGNDAAPSNRPHFNFNPSGTGSASVGSVIFPNNQWYNITLTSDGSNAKVYMNGTEDTAARFTGTFTWPNPDNDQWYWCNALTNVGGSILVKNFYFYNNITLTASQIALLAYPIAYNQVSVGFTAANGATSYTVAGTGLPSTPYTGITNRVYIITGLSGNTTYPTSGSFTVYSINGSSSSSTNGGSTTAGAITTAPGAPTISSATGTAYNNITVSWGTIGGASSYTLSGYNIVPAITGLTGTSYNLATSGGTTYGPFTLTSVNGNGSTASATYSAVLTVPAAPTVTYSTNSASSITFNITLPTGATSLSLAAGTGYSAATGITGTSYTINSLSSSTQYGPFSFTAVNASGSGPATSVSAQYTTPNAPTSVSATPTGTTTATVTWTAPSGTITSYTVSGGGTPVVAGTSATVSGLVANTNYTFSVVANAAGGSSASASAAQITTWSVPIYSMTFPFTFTNMGATGSSGPTSITYGTGNPGYGTGYAMVLGTGTSAGMQRWTVPQTRSYTFTIAGAGINLTDLTQSAGENVNYTSSGAVGVSTLSLTAGHVLRILVGQQGTQGSTGLFARGGGCGGSFVYNETTSTLLLATGGGGGNGGDPSGATIGAGTAGSPYTNGTGKGDDGQTGTSGSVGRDGAAGAGGTSGNGGAAQTQGYGGDGGAGYSGNGGQNSANGNVTVAAKSFLNGGTGGTGGNSPGGFGGGASGGNNGGAGGGGGGGYSGGGGGANQGNGEGGGGGGSYTSGTWTSISASNPNAMGYVKVQ